MATGGGGTNTCGICACAHYPVFGSQIFLHRGSAEDMWESGCAFTQGILYNRFGAMAVWAQGDLMRTNRQTRAWP